MDKNNKLNGVCPTSKQKQKRMYLSDSAFMENSASPSMNRMLLGSYE